MNGYKLDQPKILTDKLIPAKNGEIKLTHELIKEPAKFDHWYLVYTERYNEEA